MDISEIRAPENFGGPRNVGSGERLLSLAGGGLLALDGLRRGGAAGTVQAAIGAALAYRGATGHSLVYDRIGVSTAGESGDPARSRARSLVHVQHAATIGREPQELFDYWRQLENLPRFMRHLESVRVVDEKRSHWVAHAPLGRSVEWDAEIVDEAPGERIAWRSVEGSEVANAGAVTFRPAAAGRGTEVRVSLEYAPPGGRIGDVVSRIFGENPEQQIRDELRRFKQLMETGEIPTTEGQPAGRRGVTLVGTVIP